MNVTNLLKSINSIPYIKQYKKNHIPLTLAYNISIYF